ncbi:MAG: DUF559 domain-containing protein [Micromonosporaceae bacterium]
MDAGLPFSRREAIGQGLTAAQIRSRRESGEWASLRRGVYIGRSRLAPLDGTGRAAVAAAAALQPLTGDPVVSHESAAVLWDCPTLRPPTADVTVTRARRRKGTRDRGSGVLIHHAAVPPAHRTLHRGVPVTTPARTVIDIARGRSFRAGVVAADAALRRKLCTVEDMRTVCADCVRWPGVRRARAVAEFADGRAESPLESISRAAFHEHGLPAPELQVWVTDYDRVDFLWPRHRVIGEADGHTKYTEPEVLRHEKDRQELLERLGYRVVRWTWDEVFRRPDAVAHWIRTALAHAE